MSEVLCEGRLHGRPGLRVVNRGDMTQASNEKMQQSHLQEDSTPPRQPGAYWFHIEAAPWELLVVVYSKNGELVVCWLNRDEPVANMKGSWRGPIQPFGETSGL